MANISEPFNWSKMSVVLRVICLLQEWRTVKWNFSFAWWFSISCFQKPFQRIFYIFNWVYLYKQVIRHSLSLPQVKIAFQNFPFPILVNVIMCLWHILMAIDWQAIRRPINKIIIIWNNVEKANILVELKRPVIFWLDYSANVTPQ